MPSWSIESLRQIRKEPQKQIHIIDVIQGKIYDYEAIFPSEEIARKNILNDVNAIIRETYDYFGGLENFEEGMILCVFYHVKKKDLIGTIALNQYSLRNVDYIELGLSLISKKYRKMGFQSVEARRIREFAYYFLRQGNPFYISARMASAATQLQVNRGMLPNKEGKIVNVAYPRGFLPFYIANKNKQGEFMLEFGLFYDAWPTLDKVIEKDIFLPQIAHEKGFQIFDPAFIKDSMPYYYNVKKLGKNECEIEGRRYFWHDLKTHALVFGNLKTDKVLHYSCESEFCYSLYSSPDPKHLAIAVESIESLDFFRDFDRDSMKSVNFTLQISDFPDEPSRMANLAIIHVLIEDGFVPLCIYDIQYNKRRIRVALFSKWQNIVMQEYFEFLHHYHPVFQIFWHDCAVQGLKWNPSIEILTDEKIEGKILIERFKTIL